MFFFNGLLAAPHSVSATPHSVLVAPHGVFATLQSVSVTQDAHGKSRGLEVPLWRRRGGQRGSFITFFFGLKMIFKQF